MGSYDVRVDSTIYDFFLINNNATSNIVKIITAGNINIISGNINPALKNPIKPPALENPIRVPSQKLAEFDGTICKIMFLNIAVEVKLANELSKITDTVSINLA